MNELYDSFDSEREHRHRSIKHSKNVDYSKRSHHHRSRKHDKHILIHQMMTITTDPDSVDASTRTRQTMSMVIDTVLVNQLVFGLLVDQSYGAVHSGSHAVKAVILQSFSATFPDSHNTHQIAWPLPHKMFEKY
ncbi:unnamed protein product [Brassica rapa]|uniref:Uncharacterized protein n=1 Tax=Brassica campestris TaxID=3711 RepID=A0A8D9I1X8_BRACM|nr:unnamed protein product [Brassica rapa]